MTTEPLTAATEEREAATMEPAQAAIVDESNAAEASGAATNFDLTTEDGIRAAIESNPLLKQRIDGAYGSGIEAGKQRTLNEIRLDEGNLDKAKGTVKWALEQYANGMEPDAIAAQMAPHVKANSDWARADVLRGLIAQARELDEAAVAPLAELADSLKGDAGEIEKVAAAAIRAVTSRGQSAALEAFLDSDSLDDIPVTSKKYQAIQNKIAREAAAELNARQIEANKPDALPSAPSGTGAEPMNRARLDAMVASAPGSVTSAALAATAEERGRMWEAAMTQP